LLLVFIMFLSPFLWLVLFLPLHFFVSWSFICNFNKNFCTLGMINFS
jgi:hypothetical protein